MTRERASSEVEALRTDRYLDALLAAAERRATDVPAASETDPALRRTAARLRRDLVRVHPSFRFEERLARRLAETAAALAARDRASTAVGAATAGGVEPTRGVSGPGRTVRDDLLFPWDPDVDPAGPLDELSGRRPLLIRGAVASAALSLAGAAIVVARRRARPLPPMARAARAVRRSGAAGRLTRARRAPLA